MTANANREQLVRTEREFGALVVQHATKWVRRHYVISSLWVFGLVFGALFRGFTVEPETQVAFEAALQTAAAIEDTTLLAAENRFAATERAYEASRGWFWRCDEVCQMKRAARDDAKAALHQQLQLRDDAMRAARSTVGVWSTYGIAELRRRFWASINDGNSFALRWTMFDALFMSLGASSGRDGEGAAQLVMFCFKLLIRFLVNLTLGMVSAAVYFLGSVYALARDFGAPLLSGLVFFGAAAVAGLAAISLYLGAVFGVAGGTVYLVARQAMLAGLEDRNGPGGAGGQRQGRLDQRAAWQYQQHAQGRGHPAYSQGGGRAHYE